VAADHGIAADSLPEGGEKFTLPYSNSLIPRALKL
jgi:hypothetical protein